MKFTTYKGIHNPAKNVPFSGGICKFWFVPIEEVASVPELDPATQILSSDIVLKSGALWRGPVPVPDQQLGLKETTKASNSGPYQEVKVSCNYFGHVAASIANLDNLLYGRYLLVCKLRATGTYVLVGNLEGGCEFTVNFESMGSGQAKSEIAFTTNQVSKALPLQNFQGEESGYVDFEGVPTEYSNNYWELE